MSLIVSGGQPIGTIQRAPARRRASGFSVHDEAVAEAHVTPAGRVDGLAALIGLQSGGEPVEDREARRHGGQLLAQLDALHRMLLGDEGPAGVLEALADTMAASPGMARDPGLADAVGAIRLRAMVELARYGTV